MFVMAHDDQLGVSAEVNQHIGRPPTAHHRVNLKIWCDRFCSCDDLVHVGKVRFLAVYRACLEVHHPESSHVVLLLPRVDEQKLGTPLACLGDREVNDTRRRRQFVDAGHDEPACAVGENWQWMQHDDRTGRLANHSVRDARHDQPGLDRYAVRGHGCQHDLRGPVDVVDDFRRGVRAVQDLEVDRTAVLRSGSGLEISSANLSVTLSRS